MAWVSIPMVVAAGRELPAIADPLASKLALNRMGMLGSPWAMTSMLSKRCSVKLTVAGIVVRVGLFSLSQSRSMVTLSTTPMMLRAALEISGVMKCR